MGDQLAKGWADEHAKAQERHAENMQRYRWDMQQFFLAQAETEAIKRQWEIEAEEAQLP